MLKFRGFCGPTLLSLLPLLGLLGLLGLVACGADSAGGAVDAAAADEPGAEAAMVPGWQSTPRTGVELRGSADTLVVVTGPHSVVWPAGSRQLEPPYTVRATVHKQSGRIHEGYGLVFGGQRLDAPEGQQAYSYFLVRGDGSFLIRRREGHEVPILRGWASDAAIRKDFEDGGRPNDLEVAVGTETTSFRVNGSEVATLATSELRAHGFVGLRVAHDVVLRVEGFAAEPRRSGEAQR